MPEPPLHLRDCLFHREWKAGELFGLAAAAAALALVVDWWLALLIVFVALFVLVLVLVLVSRSLFRRGTPLMPEQAIEEARLTRQVMRGTRAG
jgi:membrane protein implicated in regulation of membrane protease activity